MKLTYQALLARAAQEMVVLAPAERDWRCNEATKSYSSNALGVTIYWEEFTGTFEVCRRFRGGFELITNCPTVDAAMTAAALSVEFARQSAA